MIDQIKEKWPEILQAIREDLELTDVSFKTWLRPLTPLSVKDGELTLQFPGGSWELDWLNKKYAFILKSAVEVMTGFQGEIRFVTEQEKRPAARQTGRPASSSASNLDPRYTFDSFVVGSGNRMAHAAAVAVAEAPAQVYNPLFIWGGAGLGKTHLMHSIAHFILQQNPDAKVLYVTCEKFTNELIAAIRNRGSQTTTEFHEKYRNVDVLLLDDIQFIINKESTQEEVFHTFNALYEAKKQIVISSDRPPKDFDTLEERLRSRFDWGLTTDIQAPDYETRVAILRSKEEMDNLNIDISVIQYIAANIKSNIRELEGALTKVVAYSKLNNLPITLNLAEEALKDRISEEKTRQITPQRILAAVAEHFNVSVADLESGKRSKNIVYPRHIAMYLCCEMTPDSLVGIGECFGNRDHSTVIYGRDRILEELGSDEQLRRTLEILRKKLNSGG